MFVIIWVVAADGLKSPFFGKWDPKLVLLRQLLKNLSSATATKWIVDYSGSR